MPNGLLINNAGETVVVTITSPTGATIQLYSDSNATVTAANPLTISAPTKVFVRETVQAQISLQVNGVEYATASGTTLSYTFEDGSVGTCELVPRTDVDQAVHDNSVYVRGELIRQTRDTTLGPLSNTSASDVTGLTALTFTASGRPVRITVSGQGGGSTVGSVIALEVREGGTLISDWVVPITSTLFSPSFSKVLFVTPSVGAHIYKIRSFILNSAGGTTSTGTYSFTQDSGGKNAIYASVEEV